MRFQITARAFALTPGIFDHLKNIVERRSAVIPFLPQFTDCERIRLGRDFVRIQQ